MCLERWFDKLTNRISTITTRNKLNEDNQRKFLNLLEERATKRGIEIIYADKWYASSKTCSKCGYINSELTLATREWTCPQCGEHHDRDVNAAINIRDFALHKQNLIGV